MRRFIGAECGESSSTIGSRASQADLGSIVNTAADGGVVPGGLVVGGLVVGGVVVGGTVVGAAVGGVVVGGAVVGAVVGGVVAGGLVVEVVAGGVVLLAGGRVVVVESATGPGLGDVDPGTVSAFVADVADGATAA